MPTVGDLPMSRARTSRIRLLCYGALFVIAFGVAFAMVRPISTASIGPDAAAPVVEFQRLIAGQRLEGPLTQTSKPLLTVVYGLLHSTGDWRPVAWAALTAFALSVVAGAALALRLAGPAAAAFVATGLLLSPVLLRDVSLAYALSWAALGWLAAGLAVTTDRPRWALAGLALLLAALARPEGLAVVVFSGVVLLAIDVLTRLTRRPHPPPAAYLILIGLLSVPILMAHDGFLTGDPLLWTKTAEINSAHYADVRGLLATLVWIAHHVLSLAPLLPLAALGGVALVMRRQWAIAIGLVAVVVGISLLFALSGARGARLSTRYLAPIDLGLLFAAGLGLSTIDVPAIRRRFRSVVPRGLPRAVALLLVGGVASLMLAPIWLLDPVVRQDVREQIALHAHEAQAIAAIRAALGPAPTWRGASRSTGFAKQPLVIVPPRLRVQAVVDLGLPLSQVAPSLSAYFAPTKARPGGGTILYHDRIDDHDASAFAALEVDQPVVLDGVRYVPILARPADGLWILRTEPAE